MWKYNNIRLFVQQYGSNDKQIIARLNPFQSGTVLHYFGYENRIVKLQGLVVGTAKADQLRNLKSTGLAYNLEGPEGVISAFSMSACDLKLTNAINQCIDLTQSSSALVYEFSLELYE